MRRWYVALTVLGLGGVGAYLLSERGKNKLRQLLQYWGRAPDRWLEWNESAQDELVRIQATLDRIAESLDPHPEMGH